MPRKKSTAQDEYHHGDLRRALVSAALELAGESGLESLSLREVARRVGVSTAAPYHHFSDRNSLLIELAIAGYGKLLEALRTALEKATGQDQRTRALVEAYLRFGRTHRAEYAIMFSGEFGSNPRLGEMVAVADQCLDVVRGVFGSAGTLKAVDSAEAAFCSWAMLHGLLQLDSRGILRERAAEQDRLATRGVRAIVAGVGKA